MQDLIMKSVNKHYFSEGERKKLAKEDEAMSDGSFPIRNTQDLKDAIRTLDALKTLLLRGVGLRKGHVN